MGLQRTFEIGGINPGKIIFEREEIVIFLSLLHVDAHVGRNHNHSITSHAVFLIIIMSEDVIDVLILNESVGNIILISYG